MLLGDGNATAPTALIPFRRHNLVVVRAQVHAQLRPCVEVVCCGDSATNTLAGSHRPLLGKSSGALNRGCIRALEEVRRSLGDAGECCRTYHCCVDVVRATIGCDLAFVGQTG